MLRSHAPCGLCVRSQFEVESTTWELRCFPNGEERTDVDTNGFFSVYLAFVGSSSLEQKRFPARFSVTLVNQQLERLRKPIDPDDEEMLDAAAPPRGSTSSSSNGAAPSHNDRVPDKDGALWVQPVRGPKEHMFSDAGDNLGVLFSVLHLEQPGVVSEEGTLVLQLDLRLTVFDSRTQAVSSPWGSFASCGGAQQEPSPLAAALRQLLLLPPSASHADVVLVSAEGERISAHKAILAARSPVFRAMFTHDMLENREHEVKLEDVASATIQAMLRHIYTNELPSAADAMAWHCRWEDVAQLLELADRFGLEELKAACGRVLGTCVHADNALALLRLADAHVCAVLRESVQRFLLAHADELLPSLLLLMHASHTSPLVTGCAPGAPSCSPQPPQQQPLQQEQPSQFLHPPAASNDGDTSSYCSRSRTLSSSSNDSCNSYNNPASLSGLPPIDLPTSAFTALGIAAPANSDVAMQFAPVDCHCAPAAPSPAPTTATAVSDLGASSPSPSPSPTPSAGHSRPLRRHSDDCPAARYACCRMLVDHPQLMKRPRAFTSISEEPWPLPTAASLTPLAQPPPPADPSSSFASGFANTAPSSSNRANNPNSSSSSAGAAVQPQPKPAAGFLSRLLHLS